MLLAMQDAPVEAACEQRAGRRFLLVLAAYFLLQVLLRVTSPAVLDLDESEAVLSFQHLQPGYGNQPPLYFWLQWLTFSVFGINLFALSFQKNLLLFCTYLAMFHTARSFIGMNAAIIAAASLILFPQLGWESQRDLTHSVLATCMAALALWCYAGLLRQRSRWRHALFGLLIGLGLQSKYNFALFALGLLAASLMVREHRRAVWTRDAWLTLAVAALSLAPHGLWLFHHLDAATGATLEKMQGHGGDYASSVARGFGNLVGATLLFATPPWIVYGWIWWRHRGQARAHLDSPAARFILWFYLAAFACVAALVLSGELARIKSRWMQPVLFLLPLAFLLIFPALARRTVRRTILWAAGLCAILILAGMLGRAYLDKDTRAPFGALSAQLMLRFPQPTTVVANDLTVAGNLFLHHPAWTVVLLPKVLQSRPALRGELLLIAPVGQPDNGFDRFLDAYPAGVIRQRGRLEIGTPQDRQGAIAVEYALVSLKDA